MTQRLRLSLAALLLMGAAASLLAQAAPTAKKTKTAGKPTLHHDPAERAFQANCSRCHTAPESLSPRITGTVVRHMRVRANLSAEEERLILTYLNP